MPQLSAPIVSVVIPTYNHSDFLGRCLQSLVEQSYPHWEAIVVDNHSSDSTDDVLRGFSESRIKVVKVHNFGVIGVSRDIGVSCAKGEFIAFLDSDDWWTPDKLKMSLDALNSGADVVFHDLFIAKCFDQFIYKKKIRSTPPKHPMFQALLCNGMSIPNSSVVVRRDVLLKIGGISRNNDLVAVEDYDTWIRISRVTDRFIRLNKCLGYYWVGDTNMSKASPAQIQRIKFLYSQYLGELSSWERRKAEGFLDYRVARIALRLGDFSTALSLFRRALLKPIDMTYRLKASVFIVQILWQKS